MRKLVLLALCLMAGPALGEVYKCRDGDGSTVYSDTPCGQAVPLPELPKKAQPAQGLRPGEKQLLRSVETREAAGHKDDKQRRSEERVAQRRAEQDAKSCRSAKRRIAEIEEELRQGYKAKRGEKLKRKLGEHREDAGIYCKQ
ncbi:MAG: DUF4124 domain-containing protein [Proteobacteria bacterium]|nr:DUF4124 domain-containing protein [Pseudomonadota bacterium]